MYSQKRKNIISLIFLSVFLLLRIADVHAFTHFSEDEDEVHCELCEVIAVNQSSISFTDQVSVSTEYNIVLYPVIKQFNSTYEEPLHCIVDPPFIYNKPPPGL